MWGEALKKWGMGSSLPPPGEGAGEGAVPLTPIFSIFWCQNETF